MRSFLFLVRLDTQKHRDRVLPRLFRNATRAPIAILAPPRAGKLFRVVDTGSRQYRRALKSDSDSIVGVYHLRGDRDGLIEALMEDMRDAAARLA